MKTNKTINIITIALFALSAATIPASAEADGHNHRGHAHKKKDHKEGHADHMLAGYDAVSNALYKDNLVVAKAAAAGMVKHDKKSSMAPAAAKLAKSSTIAAARENFLALSKTAIKVAKGDKGWHVMYCPMAFNNKGASWLQKSSEKRANNPYFGKEMPHCGKMVK